MWGRGMLDWKVERNKLLPCFQPDSFGATATLFYRRGGSTASWGTGDSLSDIGAFGLLAPKAARKQLEACQDTNGRLFRHPDRLREFKRGQALGLPERDEADFSRDHVLSLCFASLWSGDSKIRDLCRNFLWYSLRNYGRFCPIGNNGQSRHNMGSFAALLLASGYKGLGTLCYVLHILWLLVAVKYTPVGYQLVLCSEHALIAWKFGGLPRFAVQRIFDICYAKEPTNLWYEFWALQGLSKIGKLRLRALWEKWTPAAAKRGWCWTEAGRPGTGVDLCLLMMLAGVMRL
jgi:hypothetical protein